MISTLIQYLLTALNICIH